MKSPIYACRVCEGPDCALTFSFEPFPPEVLVSGGPDTVRRESREEDTRMVNVPDDAELLPGAIGLRRLACTVNGTRREYTAQQIHTLAASTASGFSFATD
jgi:hypothetical protein